MSYFTNLSQTSQDLLMLQFEFFGKLFLISFFLIAALYYVFWARKNQKETPYFLVALVRSMAYFLCWIYIFFIPLFIVWLYPQISIEKILSFVFMFYRYAILLIGLTIFINVLYFGPMIMAKLGGLNIKSDNTNKVMDNWLGKYKKLFRR